ncbi:DUF3426 domain-containing protein [Pseudomonas sp. AN-1]|uniref:DUF3426 domain-containing protein n=1 Tax=Pseudomonas sp. AN-1 TaxID=3096605 RepID=UPI002A6AFC51|nr:DUF3426 domain-containing protein [Pseudomonas sp. AN-1]WPP44310.1 DUF3426 domain-containing protein [Pseudomonas sp. AN-1]
MTESFVTQCPHCQTRFRVSRAQLGMARGAVRCGACLQVFNAAEQLADELPPQAAPVPAVDREQLRAAVGGALAAGAAGGLAAAVQAAPAAEQTPPATLASPDTGAAAATTATLQPAGYTPAPPLAPAGEAETPAAPLAGKAADDTLWIHDDLDLDNLDLDEELARLELDGLELSSEFRDLQPTHAPFGPAQDSKPDPHDESWVEALLNEPVVPAAPAAPPAGAAPRLIDEPPLELEDVDPDFPELDDDAEEAERHAPGALVAERDEPISVSAAAASLAAAGAAAAAATDGPRRSEPRLRDEGLLSLSDEPLQLDWQPPRPSWARRLLWSLLILLALGGLAGQYVYYNFEQLARQEQLRPWFERLCPLLGCQLPPRVDVSLVKSSNLTVRNHPSHPGALTVDAILYNRADFAQPFPLLELRFEDINGQPLASRSFKPGEYLAGELAGQSDMPPQTPIHIALEIIDPGTRAVNYRLAFHSPD